MLAQLISIQELALVEFSESVVGWSSIAASSSLSLGAVYASYGSVSSHHFVVFIASTKVLVWASIRPGGY